MLKILSDIFTSFIVCFQVVLTMNDLNGIIIFIMVFINVKHGETGMFLHLLNWFSSV